MAVLEKLGGGQVTVWGRNATIGTAVEELYQYDQPLDWYGVLGAGAAVDVSSSSGNDLGTGETPGTGARTVRVYGLGTDYKHTYEDIALNGQTKVTGTVSFLDVFGAEVVAHGTGNANAGDIHVVKTGTGGTYTGGVPATLTSGLAKILAGWNVTMNGHWAAPDNGGTYRLETIMFGNYTQAATVQVCTQSPFGTDKSLKVETVFGVGNQGNGILDVSALGIQIGARQAIRIRAIGASASANLSVTFVMKKV